MKFRLKKLLKYMLIVVAFLSAGVVLYMVTGYKGDYPEHSSYNAEKTGIKALYLLAGKMGFNTGRYHYPAMFLEDGYTMVIYQPDLAAFNEDNEKEALKEWILRGNDLILIPDKDNLGWLWIFDAISELKEWHETINIGDVTITTYGLNKGTIFIMDQSWDFLNSDIGSSDAAVAFIRVLERINPTKVVFNEYYHNMQKAAPGIFELIGIPGQLIIIQLLLVAIMVVIRGWRPFGRVRGEYKLCKRPENEVINALSGLYIRMKAYPLVISNYYGYFIKKYGRFLNTPGVLQNEGRNALNDCKHFIESGNGKRKELIRLMRKLEKLEGKIDSLK
ncbi:MAG: hypothetical protein PHC69_07485 [Ruminiclostridium sp.]|nr:hypothetical protein [Ruminiclostridium sp.]